MRPNQPKLASISLVFMFVNVFIALKGHSF